jgi:hypothetical protein
MKTMTASFSRLVRESCTVEVQVPDDFEGGYTGFESLWDTAQEIAENDGTWEFDHIDQIELDSWND